MTTMTRDERRTLAETVRQAASAAPARQLTVDLGPCAVDDALWETLTTQIGLAGLLVPEELGGAGGGLAEVVTVLGELAARLSPVPALASLGMAGPLLAVAGDGPEATQLRRRLAGGLTATVAWPHPDGFELTPTLQGERGCEGVRVTGDAAYVIDGMAAQVLVAPAAGADGVVLVSIDLDGPGVQRSPMTALDLTRGLAVVSLDSAPATMLSGPHESGEVFAAGLDIALTCCAAEQVAVAQHCLDAAVAWAKERVQFDRPIGSFQAMKHTLVDLLLDLELSRSALDIAVAAADRHLAAPDDASGKDLRIAASAAKSLCSDVAVRVTDETLHVFGGVGFTWEHEAHLYFRRARTLEALLGSPADHRTRLAAAVGVGAW